MIGELLGGRFRIQRELGRGATAIVYLAKDERLGTEVAVKVLAPHLVGDPGAAARLQRELGVARQVASPAVARVYDFGVEQGTPYVVMEYGPRGTLKDHLLRHGALGPSQLDRVLEQIAEALAACHAQGVLHRDLKPSNVLFDAGTATIKLIDFGVATMADGAAPGLLGSVVGTPEYMAPEQFTDAVPDPRSDLYSAGVVLYEAATGVQPFAGTTVPEVLRLHQDGLRERPRVRNPAVGPGAEAIILTLLAREPSGRYQTAEDFALAVAGRARPEPPAASAAPACPQCGSAGETGLPFCAFCGTAFSGWDGFGRWEVVVVPQGQEDLARVESVLDRSLPVRALRTPRRELNLALLRVSHEPAVVLQFASEPLARWLGQELRRHSIPARVRRLRFLRALAFGCLLCGFLAVLGHFAMGDLAAGLATAGILSAQGAPLRRVAFLVLHSLFPAGLVVGAALVEAWLVRQAFTALASLTPLDLRPRPTPALEEARRRQQRLRSHRFRSLGRDLLITLYRLERDGRPHARAAAILAAAGPLLEAADTHLQLLGTGRLTPPARRACLDALARATCSLLRVSALLRREETALLRARGQEVKARQRAAQEASQALEEALRDVEAGSEALCELEGVRTAAAS